MTLQPPKRRGRKPGGTSTPRKPRAPRTVARNRETAQVARVRYIMYQREYNKLRRLGVNRGPLTKLERLAVEWEQPNTRLPVDGQGRRVGWVVSSWAPVPPVRVLSSAWAWGWVAWNGRQKQKQGNNGTGTEKAMEV